MSNILRQTCTPSNPKDMPHMRQVWEDFHRLHRNPRGTMACIHLMRSGKSPSCNWCTCWCYHKCYTYCQHKVHTDDPACCPQQLLFRWTSCSLPHIFRPESDICPSHTPHSALIPGTASNRPQTHNTFVLQHLVFANSQRAKYPKTLPHLHRWQRVSRF